MRHNKNENFFSKPSVLNSYWAGFIAADGCITDKTRVEIGLNKKDKIILERFLLDVESNHNIRFKENEVRIGIRSKSWVNDLEKYWNITPCKSLTLQPPNLTKLEHKLAYIVGYIDGDGYIGIINDKRTKSEPFLKLQIVGGQSIIKWISETLYQIEKYPKPMTICSKTNCKDCKYISCGNLRAKYILIKLYNSVKCHKMERKWDKVQNYI